MQILQKHIAAENAGKRRTENGKRKTTFSVRIVTENHVFCPNGGGKWKRENGKRKMTENTPISAPSRHLRPVSALLRHLTPISSISSPFQPSQPHLSPASAISAPSHPSQPHLNHLGHRNLCKCMKIYEKSFTSTESTKNDENQ